MSLVKPENKVKKTVTSPETQVRISKQRFTRKDIAGAKGWQIGENGLPYKHRKRQPTWDAEFPQFPTVDFGNDYTGFLLPASGRKGLLLLDEIVCQTFHGWPAVPAFLHPYQKHMRMGNMLWWSHIIHRDGDDWNCHADNLAWATNEDDLVEHTLRAIMWPDRLVKGQWQRGKTRASGGKKRREGDPETTYVSSSHVPDWMPVNNKGKNIA
jgi:hypothetical protein